MNRHWFAMAGVAVLWLGSTAYGGPERSADASLPYQRAGLNERQAAAVLLDRLTFGSRPGDVDRVVAIGLDLWLAQQLNGALPEPALEETLGRYEALGMSDEQLIARYPNSSQVSAHVRRFHPELIPPRDVPILDFSVVTAKLDVFRAERGILSQDVELREQVLGQKVVRAVVAENQLREVLTDFWQNHFFTSPISFNARVWVLPFERDAIRPNALGDFRALLGDAARHPAMLQYYVGTARPAALPREETTMGMKLVEAGKADPLAANALGTRVREEIAALEYEEDLILQKQFWAPTGPNEQHARAVLELQTLGPDGPQTRDDVAEAARVFTGWGAASIGPTSDWFKTGLHAARDVGFVRDGGFLFRADRHDATPKRVLGRDFPAGGGVEEGEQLLDVLAAHPSTARHIATKLAVRFVSDAPPDELIERLAKQFTASRGDLRSVMRTLVESPEFWRAGAERSKVKTPFELAASALRATGASLDGTRAVVERIAAMGQPIYAFLEPTGFPDNGAYWLDSASMLGRINFARDLAAGRIEGVLVDTVALAGGYAPAEHTDLLAIYAERMLPGRELGPVIAALASAVDRGTTDGVAAQAAALIMASPDFQVR